MCCLQHVLYTAVPRNSGHFCSTGRFSHPVETAGLRLVCQPSVHFCVHKANQPVPSRFVRYSEVQLYLIRFQINEIQVSASVVAISY